MGRHLVGELDTLFAKGPEYGQIDRVVNLPVGVSITFSHRVCHLEDESLGLIVGEMGPHEPGPGLVAYGVLGHARRAPRPRGGFRK